MLLMQGLLMDICTSSLSCAGLSLISKTSSNHWRTVSVYTSSTQEYTASKFISLPLCELIREQLLEYPFDCIEAQTTAKKTVRQERNNSNKASVSSIREDAPAALQRHGPGTRERSLKLAHVTSTKGVQPLPA